jgi:hypothetical protein
MKPVSMLRTGSPAKRQEIERRQPQGCRSPNSRRTRNTNIAADA